MAGSAWDYAGFPFGTVSGKYKIYVQKARERASNLIDEARQQIKQRDALNARKKESEISAHRLLMAYQRLARKANEPKPVMPQAAPIPSPAPPPTIPAAAGPAQQLANNVYTDMLSTFAMTGPTPPAMTPVQDSTAPDPLAWMPGTRRFPSPEEVASGNLPGPNTPGMIQALIPQPQESSEDVEADAAARSLMDVEYRANASIAPDMNTIGKQGDLFEISRMTAKNTASLAGEYLTPATTDPASFKPRLIRAIEAVPNPWSTEPHEAAISRIYGIEPEPVISSSDAPDFDLF